MRLLSRALRVLLDVDDAWGKYASTYLPLMSGNDNLPLKLRFLHNEPSSLASHMRKNCSSEWGYNLPRTFIDLGELPPRPRAHTNLAISLGHELFASQLSRAMAHEIGESLLSFLFVRQDRLFAAFTYYGSVTSW